MEQQQLIKRNPLERIRSFANSCLNSIILCTFYKIGGGGPVNVTDVAYEAGDIVENSMKVIKSVVIRLHRNGLLERVGRGMYKPTLDYDEKLILSVLCKKCIEAENYVGSGA